MHDSNSLFGLAKYPAWSFNFALNIGGSLQKPTGPRFQHNIQHRYINFSSIAISHAFMLLCISPTSSARNASFSVLTTINNTRFRHEPYYILRINPLRHSDTIWQHRSGSTLAQVMACCLTASSHYLNQRWLISEALWHSSEGIIMRRSEDTNHSFFFRRLSMK